MPTLSASALTRRAIDWNCVLEVSVSSSNSALTPFFVQGVCAQSQPPALSAALALAGSKP